MKRFIIILLAGMLLLGLGIMTRCKYDPILNREVVHYCKQCYSGEGEAVRANLKEGTVTCKCGETLYAGNVVYTNMYLIESDLEKYGDLYRNSVYSIIFGGIVILLGVMDGLREWSEENGC